MAHSTAVAGADVVFTDSVSLAAIVRQRVPGTETQIIRFGVETRPAPSGAGLAWRRRLEIADDAFVLLSSRLVRPNYNIDTIIRALPLIRSAIPHAVLVLKEVPRLSYPDYRRTCLDLAVELGVGDALRAVGELDRSELLELHAAADVYVSVPMTDGASVSVFEAMAAGVAVVASDVPGIDPTILRNNDTALLVPRCDPESLAAAVVAVASDASRRRTLVEHAREVVQLHGDFRPRALDRAVRLYDELVDRRPRGGNSTSDTQSARRS